MHSLLPVIIAAASLSGASANPPATVLFLGDSLTAGLGVSADEAWPSLLDADWRKRGIPWRARNAAVSGATSAGLRAQADWAVTPEVRAVFICAGANDGMRGISPRETRRNLEQVIASLQARGLRVALAGMKIPPNYGKARGDEFAAVFPALAKARGIPLMPFLLEGVAAVPALNQADGIHPNAEGHRRVAAAVEKFFAKTKFLK